ncbi:hypothetical protein [Cohnella hongkongensis]|uniref:Uncharacterized protein n=1 Tax=Cohnella hongkongensis TaxID=178337 RepID=A0ABV9FHT5_9BACL
MGDDRQTDYAFRSMERIVGSRLQPSRTLHTPFVWMLVAVAGESRQP